MAVNRTKTQLAIGPGDNFVRIPPMPIAARRAPTARDLAAPGTLWLDQTTGIIYGFVSQAFGWTSTPAAGATTLASLIVNPGNATVSAGNLAVTLGNFSVGGTSTLTGAVTTGGAITVGTNASIGGTLGVTGVTTFTGAVVANNNVTITGNLQVTGDFDITDTASISLTSTNNAAGAITLNANGGAAETILIRSQQGTGADSLNLVASTGGITLTSNLATADGINLNAVGGGVDVDGALQVNITSSQAAAANSVRILASAADGGVDMDSGTGGFTIDSTGAVSIQGGAASDFSVGGAGIDLSLVSAAGRVVVNGEEAAADAVRILSAAGGLDANVALQMNLDSSQAAAADSVRIVASAADGGIDIDSGTGGITIDSTGAFSIDGAAASNVTTTGAGIDLTLSSVLGSVLVRSTEDAALAIRLHANGGVTETIQLHSDQGTAVNSIDLLSDVGGITLTSTGLASADAINLSAAAGGIDMDSALQTNITSSQAAVADSIRILASAADGGIDVDAGTGGITIDTTGALSLDSAAASNFTVTGAFDLTLSSSAGSVIVQGAEAVADAVQITASNAAGGLDLNAGSGGVAIDATGGSISLTAGTGGNGTITLTSTGTGDIVLDSDDTMLLDADGVLELNSSAGAINIGNDANAQAINIGSAGVRPIQVGNATAGTTLTLLGPANVGVTLQNSVRIMTGAGSPNGVVTAPIGSLWLRTDAGGATERIYVNTDAGTTWTNVTCAA